MAALGLACAAREELAPPLSGGRLSRAEARDAREAYELGLERYQTGDYQAALGAFTTVVERYPASAESGMALYWRGRSLYQLRREAEAAQALDRYLALAPDVPFREHALLLLANSLYGQRRFEEALDVTLRIERVSEPRIGEFLNLSRDLIRQLPRQRIEAVAAAEPARNFLAPFYLQAARWAYTSDEPTRARALASKALRFPELPPDVLDDARAFASRDPRTGGLRVGFIAPTESRFARVSEDVQRGIDLALADINRGRAVPIELVRRTTVGDPDSTTQVIRSLARDEHVEAILGPLISEVAVPAARAANEEGVPLVSPTATDARLLEIAPRVYTVNALDGAIGHTIGTYAVRVLGRRRFAILARDDLYGRIQADAFETAVTSAGGRVVTRRSYAPNTTQFTDDLGDFVRNQADAIFLSTNNTQEALRILNQIAFYELQGLLPLGTDAWNDEEFFTQGRGFVRGYFADTFTRDPQVTRWEEFETAYSARYGTEPRDLIPAWGYDATRLAVEVLARIDGAQPSSGPTPPYRGASALFRIYPGGEVRRAVVVHRVDRGEPVAIDW